MWGMPLTNLMSNVTPPPRGTHRAGPCYPPALTTQEHAEKANTPTLAPCGAAAGEAPARARPCPGPEAGHRMRRALGRTPINPLLRSATHPHLDEGLHPLLRLWTRSSIVRGGDTPLTCPFGAMARAGEPDAPDSRIAGTRPQAPCCNYKSLKGRTLCIVETGWRGGGTLKRAKGTRSGRGQGLAHGSRTSPSCAEAEGGPPGTQGGGRGDRAIENFSAAGVHHHNALGNKGSLF